MLNNKFKRFTALISMALMLSILPKGLMATQITLPNGPSMNGVKDVTGFWNHLIGLMKHLVFGVTGILAVLLVGVFAYKCFCLASSSNNPNKRSEAIQGILYSLMGIALFGATSLITGLAFNILR